MKTIDEAKGYSRDLLRFERPRPINWYPTIQICHVYLFIAECWTLFQEWLEKTVIPSGSIVYTWRMLVGQIIRQSIAKTILWWFVRMEHHQDRGNKNVTPCQKNTSEARGTLQIFLRSWKEKLILDDNEETEWIELDNQIAYILLYTFNSFLNHQKPYIPIK